MKLTKILSWLVAPILTLGILPVLPAQLQPGTARVLLRIRTTGSNYGMYFVNNTGQEDLEATGYGPLANPTNIYAFVTKEGFVTFANGDWIEAGDTVGGIEPENQPGGIARGFWRGPYIAARIGGVYQEWFIPTNTVPSGRHSFEISYDGISATNTGKYQWAGYYDGNRQLTLSPITDATANRNNGWIENNDTVNTFTNGTFSDSFYSQEVNSSWQIAPKYSKWPYFGDGVTNTDQNLCSQYSVFCSWYSSFSYNPSTGANQITYYNK